LLHVDRSTATHPCSTATHPCSIAAHPCSIAAHPCSIAAHPCSIAARPCSIAAHPCSIAARPCSIAARPCSIAARPCSIAARPCSIAAHPCSIAAHPCSIAALGGSMLRSAAALPVREPRSRRERQVRLAMAACVHTYAHAMLIEPAPLSRLLTGHADRCPGPLSPALDRPSRTQTLLLPCGSCRVLSGAPRRTRSRPLEPAADAAGASPPRCTRAADICP
jgi:hypothetical protein